MRLPRAAIHIGVSRPVAGDQGSKRLRAPGSPWRAGQSD
jgi:hypothetical protein